MRLIKFMWILPCILILSRPAPGVSAIVMGQVTDRQTGLSLPLCNISIIGTGQGTASNLDGFYQLHLEPGQYTLRFQYIGYQSHQSSVDVTSRTLRLNIWLEPQPIPLQAITVYSDQKSEAERLILKASEQKNRSQNFIRDYQCHSYTKTSFRFAKNPEFYGGIIETFSNLTYNAPDQYQEVILSQKQTANLPESIQWLSGNTFLDVNTDRILLGGKVLIGPTAPDAIDHYHYEIIDTLYQDHYNLFQIRFTPKNPDRPGMDGTLILIDRLFLIQKIDARLTEACNYDAFKNIHIIQRYQILQDSLIIPWYSFRESELQLLAVPGYPKMITRKENFRGNYRINEQSNRIRTDIETVSSKKLMDFNTVPMQIPPLSQMELRNYEVIDSVVQHNFKMGLFIRFVKWMDIFDKLDNQPFGPFSEFFRFNRVEGAFTGLSLNTKDQLRGMNLKMGIGYGISDHKTKFHITPSICRNLGAANIELQGSIYQQIRTRDKDMPYPLWMNSWNSLMKGQDYFDYYYSAGQSISLGMKRNRLTAKLNLTNEYHRQADRHVDRAISKRRFKPGMDITKGFLRGTGMNLLFSTITYRESSFERGLIPNQNYLELELDIESSLSFLNSDFIFKRYAARIAFCRNTYSQGSLTGSLIAGNGSNSLPPQKWFELASGMNSYQQYQAFRTLEANSLTGQKKLACYLEHNFYRSLPLIKYLPWDFSLLYHIGWAGDKPYRALTYDDMYSEYGFTLDGMLSLFKFECLFRGRSIPGSTKFSLTVKIEEFDII